MAFVKWVSSFLLVLFLSGPTLALTGPSIAPKFLEEAKTAEVFDWMVHVRRQIHEYPELRYELFNTSKLVKQELDKLEIPYNSSVAITGVIGYVGTMKEPYVALRADMDALPITELVEWEHKSKVPGKMHACGHDAHTAMLLGAAKILKAHEKELKGTVLLVFQPAEEGGAGAREVLNTGLLDKVQAIFGLHVATDSTVGEVSSKAGYYLAGSGTFKAKIKGQGGHAGMPHFAIDPVVTAANVIISLQHLISREADPADMQVVTVSTLKGSSKTNIIPDIAEIGGSFRAFSTFKELKKRIEEVIVAQASVSKCNATVDFIGNIYPPLNNDKSLYDHFKRVATEMVGSERVVESPKFTTSDDFAFYQEKLRGLYFSIGIKNETLGEEPVHSSYFQIAEDAFPYGAALHASLASAYLSEVLGPKHKSA